MKTLELKTEAEVEVVVNALLFDYDMLDELGWNLSREEKEEKRNALKRLFKRLTGQTIAQYRSE